MEDVGRYRVTRRIAAGGMAEVFEGVSLGTEGFQRRVAIKRMRAENAADPAFGRMFLDEANIASQLHHASIVAVVDFGVADGYPFQVLEFVDGLDTNRLLEASEAAGAPLPLPLALAICTDIAHALEHAHRAVGPDGRSLGIVHRDVSPGNILVSWSGDVKLTDFGIAFARGRMETTSAGLTKGTLLYMAPEQIMRGEIDGRTDLFGLGCVLHALTAGKSPLAAENAMADLIAGKPLPISRDLPDDVFDIIVRATKLSKSERFASAGAMASALGGALARRIDRDARTLMREWLDRLRPAAPPVTAGRLDALLVFDGQRKSKPPLGETVPPLEPEPTLDAPPHRRFSRWAMVATMAPVAAAAIAVAVWARDRDAAEGATIDAAPPSSLVTAPVVPAPPVATPELADAAPAAAITPDAGPVVATALPARPRPRPPAPRPTPPAPVAAASEATGVVTIGGRGALRAEILVDGARKGFAPRALTLPVGAREIVLVRPDGTRVSRTLDVHATHTGTSPLRWVVP